jgi:hypothetical protein
MQPRLLDEICAKAKLESLFRPVLEKIIIRIEEGGCTVMTRYDISSSSYQPYREPIIRVSLKNVGEPLNVIWRLLHEYGHYLSGPLKPGDLPLQREELAWKQADQLVQEYPELILRMEDYKRCKEHDLNTYRNL